MGMRGKQRGQKVKVGKWENIKGDGNTCNFFIYIYIFLKKDTGRTSGTGKL